MVKNIITFIKGTVVGGSMLVPGVSGGTMAMILNIYDELISSITSVTKFKFKRLPFLIIFGLGALLGYFILSKPISWLLENYKNPTLFFFLGAVVGGIPIMFREAKIKKVTISTPIYVAIGFAIIYGITLLPANMLSVDLSSGFSGYIILFIAGISMAAALVLPGISTSFMLLVLGIYQTTLNAISSFDIKFLLPLGLGLIVGILLTTGILEKTLTLYPTPTYLIIIGFVFGSVIETIPKLSSIRELPLCALLFIIAAIATNRLSAIGPKEQNN